MADGIANNDGRVTLAILATKLDYVIAELAEFKGWCASRDQRAEARDKRITDEAKRIDRVEETVRVIKWTAGVGTAILVALAIAAVKKALGL